MAVHPDTEIPTAFMDAWRSRQHVGAFKPSIVVEVQKGRWRHGLRSWSGEQVAAKIPGETAVSPWQAWWEVLGGGTWVEVPGVLDYRSQQDFGQKGISVATLVVENVGYVEKSSTLGGVYHLIEQGYLSPFSGYVNPDRPQKAGVVKNAWYDVLARKTRVRVWIGYGEPQRDGNDEMPEDGGDNGAWVFNGLIDDVDIESHPNRLTVTARMGEMLTDQRVFGWAKSRTVLDPVTFCDREEVEKIVLKTGGANASSSADGHPARFVADGSGPGGTGGSATKWQSKTRSDDVTEWVQIRLPAGKYTHFVIHPEYFDCEIYVGFFVRDQTNSGPSIDGELPPRAKGTRQGRPVDEGWLGDEQVSNDINGDWKYLMKFDYHSPQEQVHSLRGDIVTGDNAVLRIGFRKLHSLGVLNGRKRFTTGLFTLAAKQAPVTEVVPKEKRRWILVDDVADVVRVVLRWAGYDEWDVEQTGVKLKDKFVVNRSNFLMDIIQKCCEQTGYVFYIDDPPTGESFGIPVFRKNSAIESYDDIQEVRDSDLLTGIKVKISEEPLAYNIRVRGREAKESDGGIMLGSEGSRRILAYYKPPWARRNRLAGVLKHVTKTYNELRSVDDCMVAAHLIAVNEALQAVTGTIEIPFNPYFRLDSQIGVLDTGTGMNTRMWITNRDTQFTRGPKASYKTSLGGSMIDTPDLIELLAEIDV